jgi:predicted PurR-regulated permease PerM
MGSPENNMPDRHHIETHSKERFDLLSPTSKVNLVILCILLLVFAGLMLTEFLTSIVIMLATSLILTYILLGPVSVIDGFLLKLQIRQRHLSPKLSRGLAILVVYLLFFGLLAISIIRLAPALSQQVKEFAHELPSYVSHMKDSPHPQASANSSEVILQAPIRSSTVKTTAPSTAVDTTIKTRTQIHTQRSNAPKVKLLSATYTKAIQKLIANYKQYISKLGSFILDIGATTLNGLIYTLTTLVLVFYLLHDGRELKDGFVELMPARNEVSIDHFLTRLHTQFHSIIKGQTLMSFLAGGLIYLMLLALGVKYALLLGVFYGIVSILPVVGPWIGLIPIISTLAFTNHALDILQVLVITGLFYIVKSYWIWPKLIRRRYDIHPIIFVLTFVACMKLVGLMGILLSFPLASILSVALKSLQSNHQPDNLQTKLPLS